MAFTLQIGESAPDFSLPGVDGKTYSLADCADAKLLVVAFSCNHCPFVVHIRGELSNLGSDYRDSDIGIVAISANDAVNYPDDTPAKLKEMAYRPGSSVRSTRTTGPSPSTAACSGPRTCWSFPTNGSPRTSTCFCAR